MIHCVYAPIGRIDGSNAPSAERELLELLAQHGPSMVADLSGLSFVSSAGLRVLLVAAKATRARGGRTVLAGPRPAVEEVLQMSGFNKIMPIAADVNAAQALLGPG